MIIDNRTFPVPIGVFNFHRALVNSFHEGSSFCNHWLRALESNDSDNHLGNFVGLACKVLSLFVRLSLKFTNLCARQYPIGFIRNLILWPPSGDVCHVAVCWYLYHIE